MSGEVRVVPGVGYRGEGDDEELERLKAKIHRDRGFNCHYYKDKCLQRRLAVRMRARGERTYQGYAALLDREPAEYDVLLDTLTINVTKFFRNIETWNAVRDEVLPQLFAWREPQHRIWSAGSSSGEEAYTMSILLHEYAARNGLEGELRRFSILGTDIDRRSLEIAKAGEYLDLSLTETPPEIRASWFTPGPVHRIRAEAKRLVTFTRRDLISEAPPPGQTLIVCRNVIIYFDRDLQERLFQAFHDALLPGGFLVLGKVETLLGPTRGLFQPVNNRERIFRKAA